MEVEKFMAQISTVLDDLRNPDHQKYFVENMKHIGVSNKSFAEWWMTYLAWSELGSEEDCKNYFWYLEDDNEQK